MFKEHQLNRLNTNSDVQITDNCLTMLPATTTTSNKKSNHTRRSLTNIQRLKRIPSNITNERCCFLLIHLLFYIIILTIVYIRLDQFTNKQEKMLLNLRTNDNLTLHKELQRRLYNYNQ